MLLILNDFGTITLGYNIETFILAFVAIALTALTVWGLFRNNAKSKQEALTELETPYEEPPIEEFAVTIVKLSCGAKLKGSKTPIAVKEFFATFVTDSGEEIELSVDEESYFQLEENKKGTLAIVNGNFYGFCEDEQE